ncbi:NADH-quinone oxidoreductase subunit NuoN [Legionella sp. W05-934-2]|jgi:NADH-quinone oxidoreductase subunit N|uniref:NADH-quinone oxidoreductase subunit NuoN n=1 Tax=Legionella sp. W05-934-2 TaxID=1198649 RepID=UPI003462B2BA
MANILGNFHLALPEIVLLITACIALVYSLFSSDSKQIGTIVIAAIGLIVSTAINILFIGDYKYLVFYNLFVSDDLANVMKVFIQISVLLSLLYSTRFMQDNKIQIGDYTVLALFATIGMMVMVSAYSLITVYMGLELLSLPLYAMTAIQRTNDDASESALKYFVMGAIASGMMLYGMSLLYGATGFLQFDQLSMAINNNYQSQAGLLSFALVFIIAGLGFKLAAVPFHMWAPDVYDGAPTAVTLFISAGPKIAAMGITFRILTIALPNITPQWQQLLIVMAILSTGIGNLLAIAQVNIKRMLAYSAISHIGYALFGIIAATAAGYAASLYYIVTYALMSAAAFGILVLMSNQGVNVHLIDDLKGLNKRSPWLAFLMLLVMFSMAGVPPLVGFFTKMLVLKALIDVQLTWIAVVGLLFAVIGAFYYLRVVKVMYFDVPSTEKAISINKGMMVLYSINCLSLLYFGLFPSGLINMCVRAFQGF